MVPRTGLFAIASLVVVTIGIFLMRTSSVPYAAQMVVDGPALMHTSWASSATTIDEQTNEADVIVHVTVQKIHPTRTLERMLEPDSRGTGGAPIIDRMLFTDSDVQVIEVFKGSLRVNETITVMQVGGRLPASRDHEALHIEVGDDRLYAEGDSHILFLKDISGDKIHAPARALYRIVNSAGRYDISGETVTSPRFQAERHVADQIQSLSGSVAEPRTQPTEGSATSLDTLDQPAEPDEAIPTERISFTPPTTMKALVEQIQTSLATTSS